MAPRKRKSPKPKDKAVALWAVYWRDTTSIGDGDGKRLRPMPALTVGFLIKRTDEEVTLAADAYADGTHRDYTTIPLGAVRWQRKVGRVQVPNEMLMWSWPDEHEDRGSSKRMGR